MADRFAALATACVREILRQPGNRPSGCLTCVVCGYCSYEPREKFEHAANCPARSEGHTVFSESNPASPSVGSVTTTGTNNGGGA